MTALIKKVGLWNEGQGIEITLKDNRTLFLSDVMLVAITNQSDQRGTHQNYYVNTELTKAIMKG